MTSRTGHLPRILLPQAEPPEHIDGGHFPVQSIEMYPVHQTAVQQLPTHGHGQVNTVIPDGRIVIFDRLNYIFDFLRYLKFGEFYQLS